MIDIPSLLMGEAVGDGGGKPDPYYYAPVARFNAIFSFNENTWNVTAEEGVQ